MHKFILIFTKILFAQLAFGTLLWGVENTIETQVLFRKADRESLIIADAHLPKTCCAAN